MARSLLFRWTTKPVLIVDDEPTALRAMARVVRGLGFEVVEAAGGTDALSLVRQRSFAMVITDQNMPVMDGLTLTRAVRAADRSVAVVVTSGVGTVADMLTARALGAIDYLPKPFEPRLLESIVLKILGPPLDVTPGRAPA